MAEVKIKALKNGPYMVQGSIELIGPDGKPVATEEGNIFLCRCGASSEKPFCDGTHSKIGFKAAAEAVPESKE